MIPVRKVRTQELMRTKCVQEHNFHIMDVLETA